MTGTVAIALRHGSIRSAASTTRLSSHSRTQNITSSPYHNSRQQAFRLSFEERSISTLSCLNATNYAKPRNIVIPPFGKRPQRHEQRIIISGINRALFSTSTFATSIGNDETADWIDPKVGTSISPPPSPTLEEIDRQQSEESFKNFRFEPDRVVSDLKLTSKFLPKREWDPLACSRVSLSYQRHLQYYLQTASPDTTIDPKHELLSPDTACLAIKTTTKTRMPPEELSVRVRLLEKLMGRIKSIHLSDSLSFTLVEANAKGGNVGRTVALLETRLARRFRPRPKEFLYAIQSIQSSTLQMRKNRNLFVYDREHPFIDNPTRWLDAILINMSQRGVPLDTWHANQMIDCYASAGRTGRATHFFYNLEESNKEGNGDEEGGSGGRCVVVPRMKMNQPPKYTKIPSQVAAVNINDIPGDRFRLQKESERDYSLALTAAFAFADSLTHGACGHDPIELNVDSWNFLIKVCCYRGALWRAIEILHVIMPRKNITPNTFSYNTILHGLARSGDKEYLQSFLIEMTNKKVPLDKYTVQALVDGFLNVADITGAISIVQDAFNQHNVLPPYTSHLKIIEFALSNQLVYEAKRHVYFIQQLWKWEGGVRDDEEFCKMVNAQKKHPKLGKVALKKMFHYYGEDLFEENFF